VLVAALLGLALWPALGVNITVDAALLLWIVAGALGFAVLGSAYPVLTAVRLSPVEAMRKT
jgi:ABC-type antimicrobial peptide transport system permease subunit